MLSNLGARLNELARKYVPDPLVLAIMLTLVALVGGAVFVRGDLPKVLDAWMGGADGKSGFWGLLSFAMQMCLILVTGHVLAESPPVARLLNFLTRRVRTPGAAVVVVSITAMVLALINWGLGLMGGALLARRVGEHARKQQIPVHYPLVVAAGYTGLLVWHGGLSGSAPLKVTQSADVVKILGETMAAAVGTIPLPLTIGSITNLLVNLGLLLLVPALLVAMLPRDPSRRRTAPDLPGRPRPETARSAASPAEKIERSFWLILAVVVPGAAAWWLWAHRIGFGRLDLNAVNFLFLVLGLALHGSVRSYLGAAAEAVKGCTGIIIQFPFYAGIMGVLAGTGLLAASAGWVSKAGPDLLPVVGFFSAGMVNLFVPSGGGQWAVQGPILIRAALDVGVSPAKMVMALAYGDQWTNMLQPFWAIPLLAVTKARARDIMGYTAVLFLFSQLVFLLGLTWG